MPKIDDLIEGYTLVARPSRKGKTPPYLKKYQERFAEAAREAAEDTKNLKGEARVRKMNELIRAKLKASQP